MSQNGNSHNRALADMVILHRVRLGLSVQRAAELAGMNRGTWTDLEDGKRPSRPETLGRVAEVLGVDVEQLLIAAGIIEPVPASDVSRLVALIDEMQETLASLVTRVQSLERPVELTGFEPDESSSPPERTDPTEKKNRRNQP